MLQNAVLGYLPDFFAQLPKTYILGFSFIHVPDLFQVPKTTFLAQLQQIPGAALLPSNHVKEIN